jgi:predicted ATP-binding protein involved in virulence
MWYTNEGLKLKNLYIKNYRVLKNFKIDFCDDDKNPLPMIILAGTNGTGKTTILESITGIKKISGLKLETIINNKERIFDSNSSSVEIGENEVKQFWYNDEIKNDILYFSYQINLTNIKDFLPQYIRKLLFEEDVKASELYARVRNNINNIDDDIFKNLNLNIEFDSLNAEGNLFFRNKITKEKFIIDELSSGEKTLISEIVFLYLNKITNKVILIDEPELSLHPAWQSKILKLYESYAKKNNCQIIIATHSPLIIGSAKSEYLRILTFENNMIEVKKYNRSYGLEFDRILLEIMGVKNLRVTEIEEKFNKLKEYIKNKNWEKFIQLYNELKSYLGENDVDLKLLFMQANLKGLNAKNS